MRIKNRQKRNAGILPAPASKLAGDPVRCAQNDNFYGAAVRMTAKTNNGVKQATAKYGILAFDFAQARMTSKDRQRQEALHCVWRKNAPKTSLRMTAYNKHPQVPSTQLLAMKLREASLRMTASE